MAVRRNVSAQLFLIICPAEIFWKSRVWKIVEKITGTAANIMKYSKHGLKSLSLRAYQEDWNTVGSPLAFIFNLTSHSILSCID